MLKKRIKYYFYLSFLFINAFTTTSCSSYFTRKGCEKVNWFQHAHDVAMRGLRLGEDSRLRECEKAETEINSAELDRGFKSGMANYCKLETAHEKGANGDSFNYEFCESNLIPKLKTRHFEGLKKFCAPDFAFSFASKGGIYKEQCPKDMTAAYMPKYRKGRQVYLRNKIASNESQVLAMDSEIQSEQQRANQITHRIASLPRTTIVSKTKKYDEITKTYKEETAVTEDPEVARQREDLEYQLRQTHQQADQKRSEQNRLRQEIHSLRSELEGLN